MKYKFILLSPWLLESPEGLGFPEKAFLEKAFLGVEWVFVGV